MPGNKDIPVQHHVTEYGFTACNTGMAIPLERHDHFEVVITLENNFLHTVNGVTRQPEIGDVVILRPQDTHCAAPIDNKKKHICRDVYIDKELFRAACDFSSPTLYDTVMLLADAPAFHLDKEQLASLNTRLDAPMLFISAKDYPQFQALTRLFTAEIIGYYLFQGMPTEKPLPYCLSKLLLQLQDREFLKKDLLEMADAIGYSRDHLCRVFKSYFKKPLLAYIKEKRIYDSLPYLLQSDFSVEEISSIAGWDDVGNYIKHFKRVYKTTPAKYRREMAHKYAATKGGKR